MTTATVAPAPDPLDLTGYSVLTVKAKILDVDYRRFVMGPCGHWVMRFRHESVNKKFAWCSDPCHTNRIPTFTEMLDLPEHVPAEKREDAYYPGKMVAIESVDTYGPGGTSGRWH